MPFPLIPIAIGFGVVAGVGALISHFASDRRHRIVLIGPKQSGKTTWTTFMSSGELPRKYRPSDLATDAKAEVEIKDLQIKLRIEAQVGETERILVDWRAAAEEARAIFYLADLSRMGDEDYLDLVEQHARIISKWDLPPTRLTLVLTHSDKEQDHPTIDRTEVLNRNEVRRARQLLGANQVVVGNLISRKAAEALTYEALKPLLAEDGDS